MIRGRTTYLRAIETADTATYHRWINDEVTNETRGLYHPTNELGAAAYLDSVKMPTDKQITFMIATKDEKPVGIICLRAICPRSRRAEISIYIGERSGWRKGYGSDAMAALIDYGFNSLNLNRIWLQMDANYEGLRKMYEALGFVREGVLRQDYFRHGEYRDVAAYGLLKQEWSRKVTK